MARRGSITGRKASASQTARLTALGFLLACMVVAPAVLPAESTGGHKNEIAASDAFRFSTHINSPYTPTLLGNGYLSSSTSWNGVSGSDATVKGLYDHLEENSYSYQALLPSWNDFDYWDGLHWLDQLPSTSPDFQSYHQTLDTRLGLLTTQFSWIDGDHLTHIAVQEFLDRQDPHLAVVRVSVTPEYGVTAGPVTFSFPIGGATRQNPFVWEGAMLPGAIRTQSVQADRDHHGFVTQSETRDGKIRVAEAVRLTLPENLPPAHQVNLGFSANLTRPALNVKFIVHPGQTYTFTKFVAVETSLTSKSPPIQAQTAARQAEHAGFTAILDRHERAWQELWNTDIVIDGDVEAQRVVHAAMYYLMSELRQGADWSVPAMALPSRAYLGRIWWDADTWIFPGMLALHPGLARSIVEYRGERLAAALTNAGIQGYHGALFPMESAGSGMETAPEWSGEIHVTGDVAMAQWRYFQATGDLSWLRSQGYPVIRAVANFWVSRVTYNQDTSHYEILHVTGPNEAIINVDNDSYTNAIAQKCMEVAIEAAHLLGETPNPEWADIGPKILIPFDAKRQVHLEHSGDFQGNYSQGLILITYPLNLQSPEAVRRNDLGACLKTFGTPGYTVGMMGNFYSIVASELGKRSLAYSLFLSMIRSYAQPPFETMTETPSNGRAVFLTSEGAFLQQVIFGFTGLRFTSQGLQPVFPPLLPHAWKRLEIKKIKSRGKTYDVTITSTGRLTMKLLHE